MNGDGMTSWVEQHLGSVVAALAVTFALLGLDWLWTGALTFGSAPSLWANPAFWMQ